MPILYTFIRFYSTVDQPKNNNDSDNLFNKKNVCRRKD